MSQWINKKVCEVRSCCIYYLIKKYIQGQWDGQVDKSAAARPDDLSSISKNMMEKDKQLPQVILSPAYAHAMSHTEISYNKLIS